MIRLRFDPAQFRDTPLDRFQFLRAATSFMDEAAPLVRDALKRAAPVGQRTPRPGRLRDSIRYSRRTSGDGVAAEFTAHTPYAGYVLRGTAPHRISARAARALHWVSASGPHFARSVNHPGTRPNPFPVRAAAAVRSDVAERWHEAIRRELGR